MRLYKLGSFVDLVANGDNRVLTQRRITYLSQKQIIPSMRDRGDGYSKVRLFTALQVGEFILAVDLMRHQIATEEIRNILEMCRECNNLPSITINRSVTELRIDLLAIKNAITKFEEEKVCQM